MKSKNANQFFSRILFIDKKTCKNLDCSKFAKEQEKILKLFIKIKLQN